MRSTLRSLDCFMDGCTCGNLHVAYRDCPACKGTGLRLWDDQLWPCPKCAQRWNALPIAAVGGRAKA